VGRLHGNGVAWMEGATEAARLNGNNLEKKKLKKKKEKMKEG
jgi:hypothetical protein